MNDNFVLQRSKLTLWWTSKWSWSFNILIPWPIGAVGLNNGLFLWLPIAWPWYNTQVQLHASGAVMILLLVETTQLIWIQTTGVTFELGRVCVKSWARFFNFRDMWCKLFFVTFPRESGVKLISLAKRDHPSFISVKCTCGDLLPLSIWYTH